MAIAALRMTPAAVAASPQEEARSFFERFVAAQNAHDANAVQGMLWDSPDFLWVSRGSEVRGVAAAMALYRSYYSGTWDLEADMAKLRTTVISGDVVQLLVPLTFTRGALGQVPQDAAYLISQTLVHNPTGWHVATILPIANTQLK